MLYESNMLGRGRALVRDIFEVPEATETSEPRSVDNSGINSGGLVAFCTPRTARSYFVSKATAQPPGPAR